MTTGCSTPAGAPPPAPDDLALIGACIAGDDAAWATLVDRYQGLVYTVARRHGLDPEASEEVFQQVFVALLEGLPAIRNPVALRKWLMTTTGRLAIRYRRRQGRPAPGRAAPADDLSPGELLERWERRQAIDAALARLGGQCERLLIALFAEGRRPGNDVVGRRLGIPPGSIGALRARCLARLLELLDERGIE